VYKGRMHNLFCDNCHSHVAKCLNNMGYGKITSFSYVFSVYHVVLAKKSTFGMVGIAVWVFITGKFVSFGAFLQTYLPFTIIAAIILLATLLT
jgi:large-conductance mechanosensitive channel